MFCNFFFSGMSLLARRSRMSVVLLVIGATLPLFGSFAYTVQLPALPITGEWQNDLRRSSTGLFGLAQLPHPFRNLLSKEVLAYLWKQTPALEHTTPQIQTDC